MGCEQDDAGDEEPIRFRLSHRGTARGAARVQCAELLMLAQTQFRVGVDVGCFRRVRFLAFAGVATRAFASPPPPYTRRPQRRWRIRRRRSATKPSRGERAGDFDAPFTAVTVRGVRGRADPARPGRASMRRRSREIQAAARQFRRRRAPGSETAGVAAAMARKPVTYDDGRARRSAARDGGIEFGQSDRERKNAQKLQRPRSGRERRGNASTLIAIRPMPTSLRGRPVGCNPARDSQLFKLFFSTDFSRARRKSARQDPTGRSSIRFR